MENDIKKMNAIEELISKITECHEAGLSMLMTRGLYDSLDRIEAEYMELSKDKNGEVIHLGDVLYGNDGREWLIDGITVGRYNVTGCNPLSAAQPLKSKWLSRKNPDTWERIEEDARMSAEDYKMAYNPTPHKGGVRMRQCRDLVRRCKKLAGVE